MSLRLFVSGIVTAVSTATAPFAEESPQAAIDAAITTVQDAAQHMGLREVASIDHARLAAEAGQDMPASRVILVSDPALNTLILSTNIRAGLDLPLRLLAYDAGGNAQIVYTGYEFLERRHGLQAAEGAGFDATLDDLVAKNDIASAPAPTETLEEDFGILQLTSAHDFETTVESLRGAVMSQGDTVWFGDVDFTGEADALGIELPLAKLLLFGGPAPGAVAMRDFPAIGLDAFCQKLLVYQDDDGAVQVIFNDIAALAELHYGSSAKPHHALNQRLTETFTKAMQ